MPFEDVHLTPFAGVGPVAYLLSAAADEGVDLAWLAPLALVGLGVAGLAGALRGSGDDASRDDTAGGAGT